MTQTMRARLAAKWDAIAHLPKWDDEEVASWWMNAIAAEIEDMPAEVVPSYAFAKWLRDEADPSILP